VTIHLIQASQPGLRNLPVSHYDADNIWRYIRSCTEWGLQASRIATETGGLLHHLFTLIPTSKMS
ncbi:uncharacterized protein METZ01_LOCUS49757, partial [marine metagenome]